MKIIYLVFVTVIILISLFFHKIIIEEDIIFNNNTDDNNEFLAGQSNVREIYKIFPEVWSQHSPYGLSYEFKVNCFGDYQELEECFLWNVESVRVISPNSTIYNLNKDFNINNYSGEITRRWVLYGDYNNSLLVKGNYNFEYSVNSSLTVRDVVYYEPNIIGYPTSVRWERRGNNLWVSWVAPEGVELKDFYKVIVWEEYGTPDTFVSNRFNSTTVEAVLLNVPFIEGGNYSVNVAVYFKEGYAFSEYVKFQW
ncbi:MAG: hypothetical protein AABX23_02825 [Nanoarchaeota archaeon]